MTNRGWPCIEGVSTRPGTYQDLNLCQSLYSEGTAVAPYFAYPHGAPVAGETCPAGSGSSISGLAFYEGGTYPAAFTGALFFADYSRKCIWVMHAGSNGLPDPATVQPFIQNAGNPVQLKIGPGGDLFYVDFNGGAIHRITYTAPGEAPDAVASATPTSGVAPLTVAFNGTASTDPTGQPLTYAWDLDGDGAFDDSTATQPSFTYTAAGTYSVQLRVTDPGGLSDTAQLTITVTPPGGGTSTRYLSDLAFASSTNGWGPVERDRSNGESASGDGRTLTLNGVTYAKGLGVHAVSDVRIAIPTGCTTFNAVVGIDDESGTAGSVTFQVFGDSTSLFTSPVLTGVAAGAPVSVNVAGRAQLRLLAANGGDNINSDHADWADARFTGCSAPGEAPDAVASATPTSGVAPLTVAFNGTASTDPTGQPLTYAWDLDGDGAFDDSTATQPSFTYTAAGTYSVQLRVTDPGGLSDTAQLTITVTPPGGGTSTRYLSDLAFASSTNGWGPVERDRSNGESASGDGRTLTLNGVTYAKGLGVHAVSDVRIAIPTGCTTFNAVVGIDDESGTAGSVTFQVFGDSTSLFTSPVLTGVAAGAPVSVNVAGRAQLRLLAANGGDNINSDHADWADARFTGCSGGGGNTAPAPTILTPSATTTWQVGTTVGFSGSASDSQDGALPASALDWRLLLHHCSDTGCHIHTIESFAGVASGSFSAPDHEYPAHLELQLTATDSAGASSTVSRTLQPQTVALTFATSPSGLQVSVGSTTGTAPMTRTMIVGSTTTISTLTPQSINGTSYNFASWSDGGARNHDIVAGAAPMTRTATFTPAAGGGTTRYLSDLAFASSTNGWGPVERDRSNGEIASGDGRTLTLNGVTYGKGLGVHAVSDVRIAIPTGCTTFNAVVGIDDESGTAGSVTFQVFGDSTSLFTSPVLTGVAAGAPVSVNVAGRAQLRLLGRQRRQQHQLRPRRLGRCALHRVQLKGAISWRRRRRAPKLPSAQASSRFA